MPSALSNAPESCMLVSARLRFPPSATPAPQEEHANIIMSRKQSYNHGKELAREIIALSKGGSKMAFKISPDQGANLSDPSSSIILSSSNASATDKYSGYNKQEATFHVHFIQNGKSIEVIYSGLDKACDFITSVIGGGYIRVQLVLYKNNMSECIEFSTKYAKRLRECLSIHIKDNLHLLDVIDVVEG